MRQQSIAAGAAPQVKRQRPKAAKRGKRRIAPVAFVIFSRRKRFAFSRGENASGRPSAGTLGRRDACCWAGHLGKHPRPQCTQSTAQQLIGQTMSDERAWPRCTDMNLQSSCCCGEPPTTHACARLSARLRARLLRAPAHLRERARSCAASACLYARTRFCVSENLLQAALAGAIGQ